MCKAKIFILTLLCFIAISLRAADGGVTIALLPADPEKESFVNVRISISTSGNMMSSPALSLPPLSGGEWLGNFNEQRMSTSSVNGKMQSVLTLGKMIRTTDADFLVIPPVKVTVGGKELSSDPVKVRLREKSAPLPEAKSSKSRLLLRVKLSPARRLCVGETADLQVELLIPPASNVANVSFPSVSGVQDALLLNVPGGNSGDPRFRVSDGYTRRIGDVNYRAISFNGRIKFMKSGKYSFSAALPVSVEEEVSSSRDNGFDDPFFNSFFRRTRRKQITVTSERTAVEILPLPPLPQGCTDSGLVGNWRLKAEMKPDKCRAGEVVELVITASGESEIPDSAFTPPELKFKNFRVYPPEKKISAGNIVIRYVMVPLEAGMESIPLKLAVLDPEKQSYGITETVLKLAVSPGEKRSVPPPSPVADKVNDTEESSVHQGLYHQKRDAGKIVETPLIMNSIYLTGVSLISALVLICGAFLQKRSTAEELAARAEKKELKKRLGILLNELKKSDDPQKTILERGAGDIAAALGLPRGATAQDIAEALPEGEVRNFFSDMARSTFIPAEQRVAVDNAVKKKLLAFIRKLALVLCIFTVWTAGGAETATDMNAEFYAGNFEKAAARYRSELKVREGDGVSPALLFNLASAEYNLGNYAKARLYLLRADLLSPGDSEIRSNLRFVEDKLHISPAADSPSQFLCAVRDRLRPDNYLLMITISFDVLALMLYWRKLLPRSLNVTAAGAAIVIAVLALVAVTTQMEGRYSDKNLIITARSAEMRSLPAENGGESICRLSGGGEAQLLDSSGQWYHVRADGHEGWVRKCDVEQVFPYGLF